jgi:hypothetical protein
LASRLRQIRSTVVARLHSRRCELQEAIIASLRDGLLDSPGGEDAEYIAGLRATVVAAVDFGLRGIAAGEPRSGTVPVEVVAQARRAARIGVTLDTVLRRYISGYTIFADFLVEETVRGEFPNEKGALRRMLRSQASLLEELMQAITAEYKDEVERTRRSPERGLLDRVQGLLAGRFADGADLGYQLGGWHIGVIATGENGREAVRAVAADLNRGVLTVSPEEQTVWAWLGGGQAVAPVDLKRAFGRLDTRGASLAFGGQAKGLVGWRLTYRQAQAAMLVALRSPGRQVTCYADVALVASALRDEALAASLVERYLDPLENGRDGGAALRETLRAYITAGSNASSAAAALGVARHTVENRLRTVEQRVGRALHTCLAELEVALRVEELERHDDTETRRLDNG